VAASTAVEWVAEASTAVALWAEVFHGGGGMGGGGFHGGGMGGGHGGGGGGGHR